MLLIDTITATIVHVMMIGFMCAIILYLCEKGPIGGAPCIGPSLGGWANTRSTTVADRVGTATINFQPCLISMVTNRDQEQLDIGPIFHGATLMP